MATPPTHQPSTSTLTVDRPEVEKRPSSSAITASQLDSRPTATASSSTISASSYSTPTDKRREFHEATWEFLHSEMLQLLMQPLTKPSRVTVPSKDSKKKEKDAQPETTEAPAASALTTEALLATTTQDDNKSRSGLSKLDAAGYSVGYTFMERITKDRARFVEVLDIIKFICKEFWMEVFKKNIDNLRTNRKGTYVLSDNKFRWLNKLSASSSNETKQAATKYLLFPCGLIRGALANLGVAATVSGEISPSSPSCVFTIKVEQ
ncbi:trafficking protein particle complex subunit 6B [Planoprotostelium fungivorum]|uniref:Trafficking protein particle complex subunit 6B n=1 Tax=Planoprotostelium fungivorum TaxID=1890364 RepID=A0A2P6MZ05_9EUKA|nr:trafficking protein particle complex subunit 6B [Planoprotostelium fungivorum]